MKTKIYILLLILYLVIALVVPCMVYAIPDAGASKMMSNILSNATAENPVANTNNNTSSDNKFHNANVVVPYDDTTIDIDFKTGYNIYEQSKNAVTDSDSNSNSNSTQTTGAGSSLFGNMISSGKDFIKKGSDNETIGVDKVKTELLPIANVLVAIASVVFVVVGSILGVQFMLGTPDKKAELKQKLIWFIVAIVLVYGAVAIFNIVVNIMSNLV